MMQQVLAELLAAAEANLARYVGLGDERAVRAAQLMVDGLRADLEVLKEA